MTSRLLHHVPVQALKGVGPAVAGRLQKLGLHTVQDVLLYLPFRYENRTMTTPIQNVVTGMRTSIQGTLLQKHVVNARKRMLICSISDGTGILILRFMHFNAGMQARFTSGQHVRAYGEIKLGRPHPEMIHPQYHFINSSTEVVCDKYLTPIYYTTEGVSQSTLQKVIQVALSLLESNAPPEILPIDHESSMPSLVAALRWVHTPPVSVDMERLDQKTYPAQQRLITEELLAYQLSIRLARHNQHQGQAIGLRCHPSSLTPFLAHLPFTLTKAQQRVINEVRVDLEKTEPMMRLVQGDVGSGKTCVAAAAAQQAILNHAQVVIMAPTEILAEQHYATFVRWFEKETTTIACVLGGANTKHKIAVSERIASGQINIIIGTHALFYEKIQFARLGLVIIDEQHRFGVAQRLALWQKGHHHCLPHQLIMTATPIPRTLAMTLYADVRISTIDELPPGRTPITTVVIPNTKREDIIKRVREVCQGGHQVYWVCTLIEESEHSEASAAQELRDVLQNALSPFEMGLIHGRMKSPEKHAVMTQFKQGKLALLVATTVIEVGVDVPNASVIIIENAERLGLAQLHQLRGRVGRGNTASHCILLYQPPLSHTARARLEVMRESTNGFVIAQKDLEIRGFGEILGTKQMGVADFKIVELLRDHMTLIRIAPLVDYLVVHEPDHMHRLIETWLPDRQKYIHA